MSSLITSIPMGLGSSMQFRESGNKILPGNSEFSHIKPEPIPTDLKSGANVCVRKSDYTPTTVGDNCHESKSTARERLGMVLEWIYRRPGFISSRLKRHIVKIESHDNISPEDAEFTVHFSDGAIVGMRSIKHDGKNGRAYRKRYKHEQLRIVQVVVDLGKKLIQSVQEVLGQLAWHGQSIFGVMIRRHRKPRQGEAGAAPSQYRYMMRPTQTCFH